MDLLLLTGTIIFLGMFGGKLFQKLKIPQVVGYIIVGLLLGRSFFGLIDEAVIDIFTPVINIALGLIGFRIGTELKKDVFKKYGCSIYAILFSEGLFSFFLVTILVTLLTQKLYLGLLLGALASATAPAATTDVLWEYKARGPLTTTLFAVIALDDALALIIYGFASVFAKSMLTKVDFTFLHSVAIPLFDLFVSCLIGIGFGFALPRLLCYVQDKKRIFAYSIATIISTIGLSIFLQFDFILSSMALGAVFANLSPQISRRVYDSIENFSPPIYVLFFVFVGARLQLSLFLNFSIALMALAYLVGRTAGKMTGAFFGATISKAKESVRKYLGLCLFSQAGVAIGLAMVIYHNFSLLGPEGRDVGLLVLNIITATTFVVQIIGPSSVKFAIIKADEAWRNVTEEDIIETSKVSDFMRTDFSVIEEHYTLDKIMEIVKETEFDHFPVASRKGELIGLISLGGLRSVFREGHLDNVILAKDVADPIGKVLCKDQPLKEAFEIFNKREVEYLPVIEGNGKKRVVGILEHHSLIEAVDRKVFERQQELERE